MRKTKQQWSCGQKGGMEISSIQKSEKLKFDDFGSLDKLRVKPEKKQGETNSCNQTDSSAARIISCPYQKFEFEKMENEREQKFILINLIIKSTQKYMKINFKPFIWIEND
jgi:hypothetical protein